MLIKKQTYNIKQNNKQSVIFYFDTFFKEKNQTLSKILSVDNKQILLIYDKKLEKLPSFLKIKKQVCFCYPLKAGEDLKDVSKFVYHIKALSKKYQVNRQTHIVSVGGGSLGDFVGFLASVWKRGLDLTHIPSTWLAAIDSAHGGKTALNIKKNKNQLGSFYFAKNIIIIKDLLKSSSLDSSYGEICKMAFLQKKIFFKIQNKKLLNQKDIWLLLPQLIQAKYNYINKDPFETKSSRIYLNLGHSLAHILELHFSIPHGVAVLLGLDFSLQWSFKKKLISKSDLDSRLSILQPLFIKWRKKIKLISKKQALEALLQDKKIKNNKSIDFIFFKSKSCFIKNIFIYSFIKEMQRQKYIK